MPNFPAHVQKELAFDGTIRKGALGLKVRRVQEWLKINGFGSGIDNDFGDGTRESVIRFQKSKALPETGEVDQQTWDVLTDPLMKALAPIGFAAGTSLAVILKTPCQSANPVLFDSPEYKSHCPSHDKNAT